MKIELLLRYLKCPVCSFENLTFVEDKIICEKCNEDFKVICGVPVLLKQESLNLQEKKQIKVFNNHYANFSNTEYKLENWRESMLNRIFENDFKCKIETYLDIGCGATGYTVIEAAKRCHWLAIGVDTSIEAMVRAKKLADKQGVAEKTAFIVCSAENLPFKQQVFDYISLVSVLEHIDNDKNAIKQINGILKRRGFVFACVPNAYFRMWLFLWPFYYYNDLKIGHKRHYSIEKLDSYFEFHKFKRLKVFYNGHLMKFYQIFLEKIKKIDDEKWWKMERSDINKNTAGVQLNAIYFKT
jgi:ubiquinone/menaquinone biosynthesis C-methylase UbiE